MSLLVIGVILLFATPIISIAALVMTLNVRDQVRRLELALPNWTPGQHPRHLGQRPYRR